GVTLPVISVRSYQDQCFPEPVVALKQSGVDCVIVARFCPNDPGHLPLLCSAPRGEVRDQVQHQSDVLECQALQTVKQPWVQGECLSNAVDRLHTKCLNLSLELPGGATLDCQAEIANPECIPIAAVRAGICHLEHHGRFGKPA